MARLSTALTVLMAAPTTEVEFNCPWCNTRLALTRADFEKERAVLCPRCSNPVDLEIQRRLARTSVSKPAPPQAAVKKPQPSSAHTRIDKPAASTRYSGAPQAPLKDTSPTVDRPAPPPAPIGFAPPPALPGKLVPDAPDQAKFNSLSDWNKPVDIDATFHQTTRPGPTVGGASNSMTGPSNPYGGKIKCPACGYENAKVPPEFSFGTVQKCSWCSKPLPEA